MAGRHEARRGRHGRGEVNATDQEQAERHHRQSLRWVQIGLIVTVVVAVGGVVWTKVSEPDPYDEIHIETELRGADQATWVAPVPQGSFETLMDCDASAMTERAASLRDIGGVPHGQVVMNVTVINDTASSMVIQGIDVDIDIVDEVAGPIISLCEGGGGLESKNLVVDLDDRPPRLTVVDSETLPLAEPISVSPSNGAPAVFWIIAHAEEAQYEWTATLRYTHAGETHTVKIDDDGSPVSVTPCRAGCTEW